jgi:hypothetical protein
VTDVDICRSWKRIGLIFLDKNVALPNAKMRRVAQANKQESQNRLTSPMPKEGTTDNTRQNIKRISIDIDNA